MYAREFEADMILDAFLDGQGVLLDSFRIAALQVQCHSSVRCGSGDEGEGVKLELRGRVMSRSAISATAAP